MISVIFAAIASFAIGIGDVFLVNTTRKIGGYSTTFWLFFAQFVLFTAYVPFAISQLSDFTWQILVLNIVLALIVLVANVCVNEAFERSNAPLIGTISASFPILSVAISVVFLEERLAFNQGLAILFTLIGLLLITLDFKSLSFTVFKDKGITLAFVAMFCWGVYNAFIKIPTEHVGWFWPLYITLATCPFLLVYGMLKRTKLVAFWGDSRILLSTMVTTLLFLVGNISFYFALGRGNASIVVPIMASYPVIFTLLSQFAFRDPINSRQVAGIIATLGGVIALAFLSV